MPSWLTGGGRRRQAATPPNVIRRPWSAWLARAYSCEPAMALCVAGSPEYTRWNKLLSSRIKGIRLRNSSLWYLSGFAVCLSCFCVRAYHYPEYSTDEFSYMANAVAMRGAGVQAIHQAVYAEAKAGIPKQAFLHLTGTDPIEGPAEGRSFRERATNPYRFAEFLPCFAIRPIFNEAVYVLHYWFGVGLLKATVLIPVFSYWLMGWLLLAWMCRYVGLASATLVSVLLLLSPPLWDLARSATPDALSALVVVGALFLLFEQRKPLPGMILLLASVYIRTDNALLVLLTLACLCTTGFGLRLHEAALFSTLAVGSVLLINHFAGDYGAKVLYYRSFVESPVAVGEFVPAFGLREYLTALRAAVTAVVHGPYLIFTLMAVVALLQRTSRALVCVATVTAAYTAAHLVIFPNPETRFFGPFFAAAGLALASTVHRASALRLVSSSAGLHEDGPIRTLTAAAG